MKVEGIYFLPVILKNLLIHLLDKRRLANRSTASTSTAPPPWVNNPTISSPLFPRKQADDINAKQKLKIGSKDVHSVADLERTSSFGSASSSPSLASLPPIKVHVDEDKVVPGIEEQFV